MKRHWLAPSGLAGTVSVTVRVTVSWVVMVWALAGDAANAEAAPNSAKIMIFMARPPPVQLTHSVGHTATKLERSPIRLYHSRRRRSSLRRSSWASTADTADCGTSPMRRRRLGSEDRRWREAKGQAVAVWGCSPGVTRRWFSASQPGRNRGWVFFMMSCFYWRKGWDSNPRWSCPHGGFQDRCLKPLGHPSSFYYSRVRPAPTRRERARHTRSRRLCCL